MNIHEIDNAAERVGRYAGTGFVIEDGVEAQRKYAIKTRGLWLGDFSHYTTDPALAFRFSTIAIALWYATHELDLELGAFTVEDVPAGCDDGPGLPRRR